MAPPRPPLSSSIPSFPPPSSRLPRALPGRKGGTWEPGDFKKRLANSHCETDPASVAKAIHCSAEAHSSYAQALLVFTDDTDVHWRTQVAQELQRANVAAQVVDGEALLRRHLPGADNYIIYQASVMLRAHAARDYEMDLQQCIRCATTRVYALDEVDSFAWHTAVDSILRASSPHIKGLRNASAVATRP